MKKLLMMFFVALAVGFQSCNNNDDLWGAIDDLKGRVQALETQVKTLNGNIEALGQLYSGATISSVSRDAVSGDYTLTLSNGETVVLKQGSDATAVIPVMGIDKDGNWQVSYDSGETFIPLGVKASAADGVTPKFRVNETTGFWQVSYDNGVTYVDVKNLKDESVSAVGAGTVTDKFFEKVELQGDEFYVKLLDGTELRVPVVKDFYCRITLLTPGMQTFSAGQVKRFAVELKGVENALVTAPAGWEARMTEIVGDAAELIVTAPGTPVIGPTRATADTSKDVAIHVTSKSGFSAISKIQVETSGETPVPPTASVANSVTVEPTENSLSFDVTLSANAESWKYICQEATQVAPDVDKVLADGVAGIGSSVTVSGLTAATEYKIYVVAMAGELKSEVASASATTKASSTPTITDYYETGIEINGVTYSKLTPGVKTILPSELDAAVLAAGGVVFVDNSKGTGTAIDLAGTSLNVGATADLVLIGRYKEEKQAEFLVPELRCNQNATFVNLKLATNTGASYLFTSGNAKIDPTLLIMDCTLDMSTSATGRYVVYDVNNSFSFLKVLVDNSIVKLNDAATNQPSVFAITSTVKPTYPHESIKVTNSVIYSQTMLQAHVVNVGNLATFDTKNLVLEVKNNTFYNLYQPNVLIRAAVAKGIVVENNVGYADYEALSALATMPNATALMCGYFNTADTNISSIANNFLYAKGKAGAAKTAIPWIKLHTNNKLAVSGAESCLIFENEVAPENYPFTSVDAGMGYFPINTAVVTNGAGASYDTKKWSRVK